MKRLTTNALTGWAFAILAGYWVISLLVPGLWLSVWVRASMLAGGALALWVWGPSAVNLLRERQSPAVNRGEVLSLMGVATIAAGVTWASVWGLLWAWHGMPGAWVSTGPSLFGQYLTAVGLALVYTSTDVRRATLRPINWWVVGFLILAAGAAGFLVGARASASEDPVAYAQCHPNQSYWTSSEGVAHGPLSPYRLMIRPRRCFATGADAALAGHRLVNGPVRPRP